MGSTKIPWSEKSWNFISGCQRITNGCLNCYARIMAADMAGRFGYPADYPFKPGTVHENKLDEPLRVRKPTRWFVSSMGDLFHEAVKHEDFLRLWEVVKKCPQHTFIFCTKRPENMRERFKHIILPPNAWLMVTVESMDYMDRLDTLMRIPAYVHGVSVEPMLGLITIPPSLLPGVSWVICGCESGPNRRATEATWILNFRDQCIDNNIPFFLKQMAVNGVVKKMPEFLGKVWNQYPEVKHGH